MRNFYGLAQKNIYFSAAPFFFTMGRDIQLETEKEIRVQENICERLFEDNAGEIWPTSRLAAFLRKWISAMQQGKLQYRKGLIHVLEILVLTEGKIPLPGFLKVPKWWYQAGSLRTSG